MTERQRRDPDDLRRRQPLLGDERRVHPPPRPEVRGPWGAARRHRRQRHALHVRRAAAPDHPGPGRRAPAARARARSTTTSRARATKARARQRAVVRGAVGAPGVVRPRRPAEGDGRAGRRGGVAVPVAGRVHGRPDAARHRGVDPHPRAPSTAGSTRTGASPTRTASSACRSSRCPTSTRRSTSWSGASTTARGSSRSATARRSRRTARSRPPTRCSTRSGRAWREAGVVVAPHAGFEDGYVEVYAGRSPRSGAESTATSTGMGDAARRRRSSRCS